MESKDFSVAEPEGGLRFNPQLIQQYLDAICDKSPTSSRQHRAAKAIIDHTQVISFSEFKSQLRKAVSDLLDSEPELLEPHTKWIPMPIDRSFADHKKSSAWVIKLVLSMFPELRPGFAPSLTYDTLKTYSGGPVYFLFFDDGIYSGQQMGKKVAEFITDVGLGSFRIEQGQEIQIFIITAYASKAGISRIESEVALALEEFPELTSVFPPVKFFYGSELIPLNQFLEDQKDDIDVVDIIDSIESQFGSASRYPYIFQHKMPDSLSSYPQVYSGYIPPLNDKKELRVCPQRAMPQVKPFLEGCVNEFVESFWESIFRQGKNMRGFKEADKECPIPPYKR